MKPNSALPSTLIVNNFDPIPAEWADDYVPNLISVVIPTYNHAHYLVDAVNSALAQSYPYVEILVVDDGSTDNTAEILQRYGNQIRYIQQENRGLSGARNSGILAAQGEYIALLDADDFWAPTYLQHVHAALATDPTWGAVYTGICFVDANGKAQAQPGVVTVPADQLYDRLLDGEFFAPSAVLVRRRVLADVGLFDLDLRASEDWEIWLRVARIYPFGGIAQPLLNYRVHGSNMSSDPAHMLHYQRLTLAKHFGPMKGAPNTWPRAYQRAYGAVAYFAAQGYYQRGDLVTGTQYLRQAFEANPALTESIDIFYELGCVNQPLGQRGDPQTLDLHKNAESLCASLAQIFQAADLPSYLQKKERAAYAHAYRALGMLAYNSGKLSEARTFLWQALQQQPRWLADRNILTMVGKTLLTPRLFRTVRVLHMRAS